MGLYLICSENELIDARYIEILSEFAKLPLAAIQLRIKSPGKDFIRQIYSFKEKLAEASFPLILNDFYYYAAKLKFDGLHIGQDDWIMDLKNLQPHKLVLGYSTHNPKQLIEAQNKGIFSYLGFGPFFNTDTKTKLDPFISQEQALDSIQLVKNNSDFVPVFSIGGINQMNYSRELHGPNVAIYSDVWTSEKPVQCAEKWLKLLAR